jgi:hypothetical protein
MAKKKEKVQSELDKELSKLIPVVERKERPKNLKIVSGSQKHDFEKNPVFEGYFIETVVAKKDEPKYKTKAGDVIGYKFSEKETKEEKTISNSDAVKRALEGNKFNTKTLWWIEFVAKRTIGSGRDKRNWNEFIIGIQ